MVVIPCLPKAVSVGTLGAITAGKRAVALVWNGKNKQQRTGELSCLSFILIMTGAFY